MRLSQEHIRELKRLAGEKAGVPARSRLFGSRLVRHQSIHDVAPKQGVLL